MESARVKSLQRHIDECKNVLAENNPRKAAEKIETIGKAYYNENMDFGIRPAYDKFGNTIYESTENLKNLECLIIQMEIKLGQWTDKHKIQQAHTESPSTINTTQIGNNNTVTKSNIGNTIINTKIKNHKDDSMFSQIVVGVIILVIAGAILFYLGIK